MWLDPRRTAAAYAAQTGGDYWIDVAEVALFHYSAVTGQVVAVPRGPGEEARVRSIFHRIVLPFLLQALGYEMLHASAVRTEHGVVAFCGDSGAGKSTIAVGLSRRGYLVWADDALLLEASAGIRAVPLPFELRLRQASAEFFGLGWRGGGGSRDVPPFQRAPEHLAAICVLRRSAGSGRGEVIQTYQRTAALTAVLAHACAFDLEDLERKRRMVAQYLAVAAQIPVFEVRVEPGLDHLEGLLDEVESRVIHTEPACVE